MSSRSSCNGCEQYYPTGPTAWRPEFEKCAGGKLNDSRFGSRMSGVGVYWQGIEDLYRLATHHYGLSRLAREHDRPKSENDGNLANSYGRVQLPICRDPQMRDGLEGQTLASMARMMLTCTCRYTFASRRSRRKKSVFLLTPSGRLPMISPSTVVVHPRVNKVI